MSYNNFIPEHWDGHIERGLNRLCVYAEDTNRKYEGTVKRCGDTVHILGSGKPTIHTLAREAADGNIQGPEIVEGTDTILVIDQIRYFNFKVGDIDKAQAVDGVLDSLTDEANEGLANEVDKYLSRIHLNVTANTAKNEDGETVETITAASVIDGVAEVSELALTKDNVLDLLDKGREKLLEHDVKSTTEIVVVIPPKMETMFRRAYMKEDTNNHEEMAHGKIAKYANLTIKVSNNVPMVEDGTYHIQMKTKRAIAYAQPLRHVEPYRPEGSFADAIKGFILFGAKLVRKKEAVNLKAKIAA